MRPDGTITTGAHRDRLSPAFLPILARALQALASIDGAPSLYVYGSVATGTARVGNSDVDLFSVGLDASIARKLATRLTVEFSSLCRSVEIGAAQPAHYQGPGDAAYGNRVFLRHYCVHLTGPDLSYGLPDYPADRAAARGFNGDISLCADKWRRALAGADDPSLLARRIARKTLFAAAGLVSVHDNTWTTDRIAAARRLGAIKPRLASSLDTLVAWGHGIATQPTRLEIKAVLDDVVTDVIKDFASRIGLWPDVASMPAR